jgi:alanine dehydrogenase
MRPLYPALGGRRRLISPAVATIPVLDADAVLESVGAAEAIDLVRLAFERHAESEWEMPAKVYLDSPPNGDFRAMPARGDGFALLKWVTSFPRNAEHGLPAVTGALLLSSAETGQMLAVMDGASVTSLRTGAAAALSAKVLARRDAQSVGVIGCGVNGAWAARCMATAGYGEGVCSDPRPRVADSLAVELGWTVGPRAEAARQDVVVTVTPGAKPVILDSDLRPGQHLAAIGADGAGKAEVESAALERCRLFCDEWAQASTGGELSAGVAAGTVTRDHVTQLGDVLSGRAAGRRADLDITLFDSTGLAIQDLAIAIAVYEAWRDGDVEAQSITL